MSFILGHQATTTHMNWFFTESNPVLSLITELMTLSIRFLFNEPKTYSKTSVDMIRLFLVGEKKKKN